MHTQTMHKATDSNMSWWWLQSSDKTVDTSQKILTTLIPLIITWFILSLFFKRNKVKLSLPPGPYGLPLLGYLPFLDPNLCRIFAELGKTYGPIFKVRLGTKLYVVLSSVSLVKEVVRDQDVTFANRDPPLVGSIISFGVSDIAFASYGPAWRKLKKILATEMLSNPRLDTSYFLRKQQVKKVIASTYEKAGQVVDMGELAYLAIANSVTSMLWGQTLRCNVGNALNSEFQAVLQDMMELLGMPNVSDIFPFLSGFDLQGVRRRTEEITRRCEEIIDSAISLHESGKGSGNNADFLGYLLQLTKSEDPETSITMAQVKGVIMDIVLGGIYNPLSTVEFAMAELMKHPNIRTEVQEELTNIVGLNNSVEETHLPELKYLKAVMKETLRLHPPVPLLVPHRASEDTSVGGYAIPKGCQVFLNMGAIQTDPQLWKSPLEFQPERFMRGSSAEEIDYFGNHLQYIPFGSGRRKCAGISLADRMMMYVMASLLHAFEWSLPKGVEEVDLSEKFGPIVRMVTPLVAIPSPRLASLDLYSCSE